MARILVIEDNPDALELMSYLLRTDGHDIVTAEDGVSGLARAAMPPLPDIIVCDIHLPRLDGCQLAWQLKLDNKLEHIPLLAVTAQAMAGDRDRVLAARFDGYISKPINPREFSSQVLAFLPDALRVASQPARGAAAREAPEAASGPAATATANGARILVVDDSADNRDLARAILEPHGYRVTAVASAAEAHQCLLRGVFDLILSDLHMPEASGLQLLATVRSDPRWRQLPFVLSSSSLHGTPARERSRDLGANRFLLRPVSPQQILDAVSSCLAEERSKDKEPDNSLHPGR